MTQPTALEQQREDAQIGAAWRRLVALTDWCELRWNGIGYRAECELLVTERHRTALEALNAAIEAIDLVLREPG